MTNANESNSTLLNASNARRLLRGAALTAALSLALVACKKADDAPTAATEVNIEAGAEEPSQNEAVDTSRIVSLNGTVTEILVELGLKDSIAGVDISSTYPPEMTQLPNVGYYRQLSDEGILGVSPSLIIGEHEAGPRPVMRRLRAAGVDMALIRVEVSEEGILQRIRDVAKAVALEEEGAALEARFTSALEEAKADPGLPADQKPRILGVYARGAGLSMVGGTDTPFDVVIRMAGGVNAAEKLTGFQPLSPEALAISNADIILIPEGGLAALGGEDGLLAFPGMNQTPAGKKRQILVYDDLLVTGLGPRLPQLITTMRADIAEMLGEETKEKAE